MNINDFGQTLRANIGANVSSATAYQMILEPEKGKEIEKTATLGTVNVVEGDQTFIANEYIEYILEADVIKFIGQWRKKGIAVISGTQQTAGNFARFTVLP